MEPDKKKVKMSSEKEELKNVKSRNNEIAVTGENSNKPPVAVKSETQIHSSERETTSVHHNMNDERLKNVISRNKEVAETGETSAIVVKSDTQMHSSKRETTSVHHNTNNEKVKKLLNATAVKMYSLPDEVIIKVLSHLTQKDLSRIERVCKQWQKLTRCPVLLQKVNILFCCRGKFQSKAAAFIAEIIPTSVTHIKLNSWDCDCSGNMNFEELCVSLGKRCLSLKVLIFHHTSLSVSLQSAIDLCRQFMPNIEIISFRSSTFTDNYIKGEYDDHSKLKILDIYNCLGFTNSTKLTLPKMSSLKNINLIDIEVNDSWFQDNTHVLPNLEMLNLKYSVISSRIFQTLQNYALKLTQLYLCGTNVQDSDFNFSSTVFPYLKTICLKDCEVTCESIVSLISSCHSLQNVHVDDQLAECYAMHSFVVENPYKLQIVKTTDECMPLVLKDYMYCQ